MMNLKHLAELFTFGEDSAEKFREILERKPAAILFSSVPSAKILRVFYDLRHAFHLTFKDSEFLTVPFCHWIG